MIGDFFSISLNNLKRRKLRSWLTMLGIFIGVAAVVSLFSLGQGLQNAVTGQFSTLSTDKLTIQNAGTGLGPPGSTSIEKLNSHDIKIIESVRGVDLVVPRLIRVVKTEYNGVATFNYVSDIPEEDEKREVVYNSMNIKAEEGRLLRRDDHGKILLGADIAKDTTFDKKIYVGKKIVIQGKEFEVLGILEQSSSFQVNSVILMLNDDLEDLLNIDDETDLIIAQVGKNEDVEDVAERIRRELRKDRGEKVGEEDFSVETPLQTIESVNQILGSVKWIVVGIAIISIIVGGIGVANTMYTAVLERRQEIGTMKAIGAKNKDILFIFVTESGLLGLVGGIIGVVLGEALAIGLSSIGNAALNTTLLKVDISIPLMATVLILSFLLGILFGLIPSYQASRLRPVEALRG